MRAVIVHGLLALFGLGFAYQTWTRKPEEDAAPSGVTVAECTPDTLQKLTLETPTLALEVEPRREHGETRYWITSRHKSTEEIAAKSDKPADPHADDKTKTKPEPAKDDPHAVKTDKGEVDPKADPPRRFLANASFSDYLKRLAPLRAARSLGQLPANKDAEFGFDKVGTKLHFECPGTKADLEAGARAFGASQRYLRDMKTKTAYLFDEQLVSDLESATFKFVQSELHRFTPGDVDEVTIEGHGAKKRLLQRDRKVKEQATWVDASAPATRNELYGNWFSRLSRLRVRAYLPTGAEPGSDLKGTSGGSEPVLTISYKVADKPDGKLELVRVDNDGTGHYYARSETTEGWVAVFDSAAKDVENDVGMVLGIEQAPRATPASKDAADSSNKPHGHMPGLPPGHPAMPGTPPAGH
jgi:Domain of unknown function (DUF4340)